MAKKRRRENIPWSGLTLMAILLFVAFQAFTAPRGVKRTPRFPEEGEPCTGEPIEVEYAYDGALLGPHECQVQCKDEKEHYILYTNGMATQCEPLPGCSDWGEDHGVTCAIPRQP